MSETRAPDGPGTGERGAARRALLAGASALLLGPALAAAHPRQHRRAAPAVLRRAPPPAKLVMLDPGHGGKDPGAIGYAGTYEKHVAIAAATELHDRLVRSGRYRCALTRDTDRFIPLEDRVAIADAHGADLFVSMHADSIASHAIRGGSVYTLSTTASDAQTAALARRENSADRFAGPHFRGTSPEVARILADLVEEETRVGSARMADEVVGALRPQIGLLPNPSRHAAFVVLKSPAVPSVLVEMGFMSNPADEALLRTRPHRDRITLAMATAIDAFFGAGRGATTWAG